nr:hypothetical protein BaRGS_027737 [Batillaria attramentaria]
MLKKLLCVLSLAALLLLFVVLMRTSDLTSQGKLRAPTHSDVTNYPSDDVTASDGKIPMSVSWDNIKRGQRPPHLQPPQQPSLEWQQQQLIQQQQLMNQQPRLSAEERYLAMGGSAPADVSLPGEGPQRASDPREATDPLSLWKSILPSKGGRPAGQGNVQPTTCSPRHHVLFLKVHKTGSSTVANILQRYGFTRHLNFVLPRRRLHSASYNYLNTPAQRLTTDKIIPPPKGQHYDILWNHATYDGPFFHEIMPQDTVYISILREPLQQFQSAFEYYGISARSYLYPILHRNVSNPLSEFLRQPYHNQTLLSYVRNKQAQDFGMKMKHVINERLRHQYIHQLDEDFHLVMITEYFDESLVLLKRLLCWDIKDILYIPKNKNARKKKRVFTDEDRANHKKYSAADYDLYNFFLRKFEHVLKSQGIDFRAEVGFFKDLLQKLQFACPKYGGMTVSSSPWNEEFEITKQDCLLMMKSELAFFDELMVDAVRRYQMSVQ